MRVRFDLFQLNHLGTGGEIHKSDFLTFSVDRYIVAP